MIYQNHAKSGHQPWNVTGNSLRHSLEKFYFFSIKIIMWTIPTVVFSIFMSLLLVSLVRHMKKTFLALSELRDVWAQAHFKALLPLLSFIVLFISCFLTLVLSSASNTPYQEFRYWMWQVVIHLCTVIHPIVILFSNPVLRVVIKRGCCWSYGAAWMAVEQKAWEQNTQFLSFFLLLLHLISIPTLLHDIWIMLVHRIQGGLQDSENVLSETGEDAWNFLLPLDASCRPPFPFYYFSEL